jgi:hypothetical protein
MLVIEVFFTGCWVHQSKVSGFDYKDRFQSKKEAHKRCRNQNFQSNYDSTGQAPTAFAFRALWMNPGLTVLVV